MMSKKIEVDAHNGMAWITTSSSVAMYAGDPGTPVEVTTVLSADELKNHISTLIKTWKSIK